MARRAGFINELREQGAPLLVLAGPDEFLADAVPPLSPSEGQADPSSGKFTLTKPLPLSDLKKIQPTREQTMVALRAYNLLGTDAGWLSPEAERSFTAYKMALPNGFHTVRNEPVSVIRTAENIRVGIVFFPRPATEDTPTQQQMQAALQAGRALKQQCDLVIGVSPWGITGEKQFILAADGVFACIFGGGDGVPFPLSLLEGAPATLWLRSESKGKAVTLLEIRQLPRAGAPLLWQEGVNFAARHVYLGANMRDAPAMRKIIGYPAPQPK